MLTRPIAVATAVLMLVLGVFAGGPAAAAAATSDTSVSVGAATVAEPEPPPSTFNIFYPEERSITECVGVLQKPNCGSKARGGWRQLAVFGSIVAGLGFIGWRIVRSTRRNRVAPATATAPGGGDGDRAP